MKKIWLLAAIAAIGITGVLVIKHKNSKNPESNDDGPILFI